MKVISHGAVLRRFRSRLLVAAALSLSAAPAIAQDATWTAGFSNDFFVPVNWNPLGVPTGILTFDNTALSSTVQNNTPATYNMNTLQFSAGAPAYTFNLSNLTNFQVNGLGVVNNSSNTVTFNLTGGSTLASNAATVNFANTVVNLDGTSQFFLKIGNDASTTAVNSAGGTVFFGKAGVGPSTGIVSLGSISGSGAMTLGSVSGGSPTVNIGGNNLTTTYSGLVSGPGGLVKVGTGTLSLTFTNTYTGGTTVNAGILTLGSTGSLATTGALTVNGGTFNMDGHAQTVGLLSGTGGIISLAAGTLTTNSAANGTLASVISGAAGALVKQGTGTLTLTGANTFTGATTVSAGTLTLSGGAALADTDAVAVNAGATLNITASERIGSLTGAGNVVLATGQALGLMGGASTTVSGVISGGGGLANIGAGVLTLTGANTYGGGTILGFGGGVALGNSSALGTGTVTGAGGTSLAYADGITVANAITIDGSIFSQPAGSTIMITPSGNMTFSVASGTATQSGIVSGGGFLVKSGAGTLILSGDNSYTGGTTIGAGTLQVGSGGTSGAIASDIADGGALIFNRSNVSTFAGVISGAGTVAKSGAGNLILSGASTYTGATTVAAGTLSVNGSIGSSAVTVTGGSLGGKGTVGATTIQSGGTLAPGNSIGTITVNGNLTLAAGSVYNVEVSPTAADKTIVTGTASLNGTLALSPAAGAYTAGTDLTLLSAASLNGTFSSVTGLSFAGLKSEIVYNATSVHLVLSQLAVTLLGRTPNQIAAAAGLNAGPAGNALQTALGNYLAANPSQTEAVLDSVSGEIHASVRAAALEDSRIIRDTVQAHLAGKPDGTALWGQMFADYGRMDSDGNAADTTRNNAGFIAGLDLAVADGVRLGVGGAYMEHKVGALARGSSATGERGALLAYASYDEGLFSLSLGGDYGWGSDDISRTVAALGETERSSRDSDGGGFFVRTSYDLGLIVIPYAGLAHAGASNGAFAESGGLAALSGGAARENQTYSLLGFTVAPEAWTLDGMALAPHVDIAWSHAFDVRAPVQSVTLATGKSFTMLGTPLGSDAAAIQLGLGLQLAPQAVFSLGYDGLISGHGQSHAVRGGLSWRF